MGVPPLSPMTAPSPGRSPGTAPAAPLSSLAARSTDLTMFSYPVQRQAWPEIASRTSASVGSGLLSSSHRAVIIMPGVQKPHCSPWQAAKASWTGSSLPPAVSPSTVVTRCPSAMTASTVQDLTGVSFSQTTQAPQLDVSQPQCEPVSPRWSRRKWMSSRRGSTARVWSVALTVTVIFIERRSLPSGAGPGGRRRAAPGW